MEENFEFWSFFSCFWDQLGEEKSQHETCFLIFSLRTVPYQLTLSVGGNLLFDVSNDSRTTDLRVAAEAGKLAKFVFQDVLLIATWYIFVDKKQGSNSSSGMEEKQMVRARWWFTAFVIAFTFLLISVLIITWLVLVWSSSRHWDDGSQLTLLSALLPYLHLFVHQLYTFLRYLRLSSPGSLFFSISLLLL